MLTLVAYFPKVSMFVQNRALRSCVHPFLSFRRLEKIGWLPLPEYSRVQDFQYRFWLLPQKLSHLLPI